MGADPYKVLGIDRQATPEEVRAAYHKMALSCHPDTFVGDRAEAERLFQEVTEAYRQILRERSEPQTLQPIAISPADLAAMQMARSLTGKTVAARRSRKKAVRIFLRERLRESMIALIGVVLLAWTGFLAAYIDRSADQTLEEVQRDRGPDQEPLMTALAFTFFAVTVASAVFWGRSRRQRSLGIGRALVVVVLIWAGILAVLSMFIASDARDTESILLLAFPALGASIPAVIYLLAVWLQVLRSWLRKPAA